MTPQIISRVLEYFGVLGGSPSIIHLLNSRYLLPTQISIELDDKSIVKKPVWGAEGKVFSSTIQVMITDLSLEESSNDYVIILQLDNLSIYGCKCFESQEIFALVENNIWIALSKLLAAKLLVGIEQLDELLVSYQPLTDYQPFFQQLISFVNHVENSTN